ncbi:hypothetical protein [Methylovorus sp. MP688]|uniref:hypothetical protein n=1 Tax=Methylovorus sp. (strain MP688) TaxID=887061 RepID=UPI0011D13941|nr:hypothetical protein [Methylovorus sp. MP688]
MVSAKPEVENRDIQKGLWEHMLCSDCEIKISKWEDYARHALTGSKKASITVVETIKGIGVKLAGIDYHKFKLFQLSVLWRAHVAKGPFFSAVDLGDHAEPLRLMLLNETPGLSKEYGCVMSSVVDNNAVITDIIEQPLKTMLGGVDCFRFLFGGLLWAFPLSKEAPSHLDDYYLQPNGMLVCATLKLKELKSMQGFAERAAKLGRLGD